MRPVIIAAQLDVTTLVKPKRDLITYSINQDEDFGNCVGFKEYGASYEPKAKCTSSEYIDINKESKCPKGVRTFMYIPYELGQFYLPMNYTNKDLYFFNQIAKTALFESSSDLAEPEKYSFIGFQGPAEKAKLFASNDLKICVKEGKTLTADDITIANKEVELYSHYIAPKKNNLRGRLLELAKKAHKMKERAKHKANALPSKAASVGNEDVEMKKNEDILIMGALHFTKPDTTIEPVEGANVCLTAKNRFRYPSEVCLYTETTNSTGIFDKKLKIKLLKNRKNFYYFYLYITGPKNSDGNVVFQPINLEVKAQIPKKVRMQPNEKNQGNEASKEDKEQRKLNVGDIEMKYIGGRKTEPKSLKMNMLPKIQSKMAHEAKTQCETAIPTTKHLVTKEEIIDFNENVLDKITFSNKTFVIYDLTNRSKIQGATIKVFMQGLKELDCKNPGNPMILTHSNSKGEAAAFNIELGTYNLLIEKEGYAVLCTTFSLESANEAKEAVYLSPLMGPNQMRIMMTWKDNSTLKLFGTFDHNETAKCVVGYMLPECGGMEMNDMTTNPEEFGRAQAITIKQVGAYFYLFFVKLFISRDARNKVETLALSKLINKEFLEDELHISVYSANLRYPVIQSHISMPNVKREVLEKNTKDLTEYELEVEQNLVLLYSCLNGNISTKLALFDYLNTLWVMRMTGDKIPRKDSSDQFPSSIICQSYDFNYQ